MFSFLSFQIKETPLRVGTEVNILCILYTDTTGFVSKDTRST